MIQRRAVGLAESPDPAAAFGTATAGPASEVPYRSRMEAAFQTDFSGVRAHLGGESAQSGLGQLGARAATFGSSVAFAESAPAESLVAHELAHVVQQGGAAGSVQMKPVGISAPGDDAERRADAAADAVMSGQPVPDVGDAPATSLHRAVDTNGGSWNTVFYNPQSGSLAGAVNSVVGADIELHFTPNDLVEAPVHGIAVSQSIKVLSSSSAGATTTTNTPVTDDPDEPQLHMTAGERDPGRMIDTAMHPRDATAPGGRRSEPSNSPVYGVGFGSAPHIAANLNDIQPSLQNAARGSHVKHPDGTFDPPQDAVVEDGPRQVLRFAGQTYLNSFEVAAVVSDGPMVNTYLGTVEWGWSSDAAGAVTVLPLRTVQSGTPTDQYMGAAQRWNDATLHHLDAHGAVDPSRPVPTADLPITSAAASSVSGVAAQNMTTPDLIARLRLVNAQMTGLSGVDLTNRQFEQRALRAALATRRMRVGIHCDHISDTGGAANPPEDEIALFVSGPRGFFMTSTAPIRSGQDRGFDVPLADLGVEQAGILIELNEHDRAGPRSRAHDDTIASVPVDAPFTASMNIIMLSGGGEYVVNVEFP